MGQTFWHLPQSMHFSVSTFSRYFLPPTALCIVPMGQKEHQVRGAMIIPKRMAIDVVRNDGVQGQRIPASSEAGRIVPRLDYFRSTA